MSDDLTCGWCGGVPPRTVSGRVYYANTERSLMVPVCDPECAEEYRRTQGDAWLTYTKFHPEDVTDEGCDR